MGWFVLCLLSLFTVVFGGSFNFEVGKRTKDNIDSFLLVPSTPIFQLAETFRLGLTKLKPENENNLRSFLFTQILSLQPAIDLIYVGSEQGQFAGYFNNNTIEYIYTNTPNESTVCVNVSAPCRTYWNTDFNGFPTTNFRNRTYDPRVRVWYTTARDSGISWSSVYLFATAKTLGITFAAPIYNTSGNFVGVAAADYKLSAISDFLLASYSGETDDRFVYVMDLSGKLIAASVENVSTKFDQNGEMSQVTATECSDSLIRTTSLHLESIGYPTNEIIAIGNYYVQVQDYTAPIGTGIFWRVIVCRGGKINFDFISPGSFSFVVVIISGIFTICVTFFLAIWVGIFSKMAIWRVAQPPVLLLMLFSNFLCGCCAFVFLGKHSDETCLLRQWWFGISFSLTLAVFLGKVVRVYLVGSTRAFQKRAIGEKYVFGFVGGVMSVVLIAELVWTFVDPFKAKTSFHDEAGELVESHTCSTKTIGGMATFGIIIGGLIFAGCYLSYLTRRYSEVFAESTALMFTFYHAAFITAVIIAVSTSTSIAVSTLCSLIGLGMCWFTIASQAMVFGARVWRQIDKGDLTNLQLREKMKKLMHAERW